jgi:hypothetical protein
LSRLRLAGVLVVTLTALGSSCPFTPRDTPEPCTPGVDVDCDSPVPFKQPLDPQTVRDNIIAALRKRHTDGPKIDPNYAKSLDLEFGYVPDATASAIAPGGCSTPYFLPWTHGREVQFMQDTLELGLTLGVAPDSVELTVPQFIEDTSFPGTPFLKRYRVQYLVTLRGIEPSAGDRRNECYGSNALWDFQDLGGLNFWTLLRWEDTDPLPESVRCATGTYVGSLGLLRAQWGKCEE